MRRRLTARLRGGLARIFAAARIVAVGYASTYTSGY